MTYQKPYTFRAGTYAKAAEVNANFDTVKDFVDDLQDAIGNVEVSKTPYNKANLQGNSDVVFYCATSSEANAAVNNTQLTNSLVDINTTVAANAQAIQDNAEEIDGLQTQISRISVAPSYTQGTTIENFGEGTFTASGILYIENITSGTKTFELGGNEFKSASLTSVFIPVRQGGSYDFSNLSGTTIKLYPY